MSWLSDGWDWIYNGVGDYFGGDGGGSGSASSGTSDGGFGDTWLGRNWGTINKIADTGRKIYNLTDINDSRSDSRNQLLDVYKRMEAEDQAYRQQVADYNARSAASAAAARRQNDQLARQGRKRAMQVQRKFLKQMMANYKPYADAAKMLTPEMANNYKQYLDTTSLLNQYLTPRVMNTLGSAPTPTAASQINADAYTAPSNSQVSFPMIEEMLKRKG